MKAIVITSLLRSLTRKHKLKREIIYFNFYILNECHRIEVLNFPLTDKSSECHTMLNDINTITTYIKITQRKL